MAAHSSSCSPGTHLHRQIDRQAPAKYDQVTSPMGIFSPSKNVVHLHEILRGQSEHLHLGTSLRECRRKTSGCSFPCEISIKPGLYITLVLHITFKKPQRERTIWENSIKQNHSPDLNLKVRPQPHQNHSAQHVYIYAFNSAPR